MARTDQVTLPDGTRVAGLLMDVLKLRSLGRKLAFIDGDLDKAKGPAQHPFKVFEFPDTMPVDGIEVSTSATPGDPMRVHPEARLSPLDCRLVNRFVGFDAPPQ